MKKLLASVCVISFLATPVFAGGIERESEQYRDAPPPTLVYKKPTTEPKSNRNGGERKNPPITKPDPQPEPEPEKPVDPEPEKPTKPEKPEKNDPCACGPEWQAEQANKV